MRRPIPPALHGVADWGFTAAVVAIPHVFPASPRLARTLRVAAVGLAAMSALTDYRLGVLRVLPMRGHLALDVPVAAAFIAAPALAPHEDTTTTAALSGLGWAGAAIAALTRPNA